MQLLNWGALATKFAAFGVFMLALYDPGARFKRWREERRRTRTRGASKT